MIWATDQKSRVTFFSREKYIWGAIPSTDLIWNQINRNKCKGRYAGIFSCLNEVRNLRVTHIYIINLHRGQIVQFATFRCVIYSFCVAGS